MPLWSIKPDKVLPDKKNVMLCHTGSPSCKKMSWPPCASKCLIVNSPVCVLLQRCSSYIMYQILLYYTEVVLFFQDLCCRTWVIVTLFYPEAWLAFTGVGGLFTGGLMMMKVSVVLKWPILVIFCPHLSQSLPPTNNLKTDRDILLKMALILHRTDKQLVFRAGFDAICASITVQNKKYLQNTDMHLSIMQWLFTHNLIIYNICWVKWVFTVQTAASITLFLTFWTIVLASSSMSSPLCSRRYTASFCFSWSTTNI